MFDSAIKRVRKVPEVCDVGPGIKPMSLFKADKHICIEPHEEYAQWLEDRDFHVIRTDAITGLQIVGPVDSVFFLDSLEHMDKKDGLRALQMATERAREQVVVFTPLGFIPQSYKPGELDAWGMNGAHWQTHRSGWMPEDFPGWDVLVDPSFHKERGGALCAIRG